MLAIPMPDDRRAHLKGGDARPPRRVVLVGDPGELDVIASQLREQARRHARGEGPAPTSEDAREWARLMPGVQERGEDG